MIRDKDGKISSHTDQEVLGEDYFVDEEIDNEDYWLDDEEDDSESDEYDSEDEYEDDEDEYEDDEDEYEDDEDEYEDDEDEYDDDEDEYEDDEDEYDDDEDEYEDDEDEYDDDEDEYDDEDDSEDEYEDDAQQEDYDVDDVDMKKGKQNKKIKNKSKAKKKKGTKKNVGLVCVSVIAVVCALYVGVSCFFLNHFYINTKINGKAFSGKTADDAEKYIKNQVAAYQLNIIDKDGNSYIIDGASIDLSYTENNEISEALKKQNAFLWPVGIVKPDTIETKIVVAYDEGKLDAELKDLDVLKVEQIEPVSAHPVFNGEQYVVEPEVVGTTVDVEKFESVIIEDILNFDSELNMMDHGCYKLPKYVSDSPEVQAACDHMNTYLKASITYSMDEPVVVDKALISKWLSVDDNMNVTFDENAVREWLKAFGQKYDTVGKTRTFTTPWGRTAEVSGGTYGWGVDEDAEYTALLNSIKNGEVVTKDPAYCEGQTADNHGPQDWGTTYAEVDLSAQHMWYIENGNVVVESDVVTGVPIPEKETTAGVFSILEKASPKTLVGDIQPETGKPEYETPVDYWMRVTWSGIGFHDATWQPAFGGSLYADGAGSHGCINMPLDKAAALYNVMPEGTPVIVHY